MTTLCAKIVMKSGTVTLRKQSELSMVQFPRTYKPDNCNGDYILLISWDASRDIYQASAYICWILDDGSHILQLILAKSKINPHFGLTISKMELIACLLSCQLLRVLLAALYSYRLPISDISTGDSKSTLSSIKILF